jgi:hypothetical protein
MGLRTQAVMPDSQGRCGEGGLLRRSLGDGIAAHGIPEQGAWVIPQTQVFTFGETPCGSNLQDCFCFKQDCFDLKQSCFFKNRLVLIENSLVSEKIAL